MTPDAATPAPSSARERIVTAALEGFASGGVKATSIRDVANAAGVSPGLVQHYFGSKAALREAVDEHVNEAARTALEVRRIDGDVVADLSERLTRLVADHFTALRYVARGVAESEPAAMKLFGALTQLCRDQLADLQRQGMLRSDLDLEWAALHTVLINLGTVVMEPGVSEQLGRPFLGTEQVRRWQEATTKLFSSGELAPG